MTILFLCTGHSCRSQMAEGWARHLKRDAFEAYSAGIEKHGMNPHAGKVMAEAGADISGRRSKTAAELGPVEFDYVVTVVPALKRMVCGATRTLVESGLSPEEVMDRIPMKALADLEPQAIEMYRTRLPGV